ncbi:phasin family protein [Hypericibacter sp.]|uniref:phasin family protein n=1 Tax=Hypericibacter sp. TaxID=2705401 RepID=UPI003D6D7232
MARVSPQAEVSRPTIVRADKTPDEKFAAEVAPVEAPKADAPNLEAPTSAWSMPEAVKPEASVSTGSANEVPHAAVETAAMPMMDAQAWAGAGSTTMNAMLKANDVMVKGMMAWSREMVDFTHARLQESAERSAALMQCTDPTAVLALHRDFTAKATEQYLEEAGKLTTMAMRVASEYWMPIEEGARSAFGRIGNSGHK